VQGKTALGERGLRNIRMRGHFKESRQIERGQTKVKNNPCIPKKKLTGTVQVSRTAALPEKRRAKQKNQETNQAEKKKKLTAQRGWFSSEKGGRTDTDPQKDFPDEKGKNTSRKQLCKILEKKKKGGRGETVLSPKKFLGT